MLTIIFGEHYGVGRKDGIPKRASVGFWIGYFHQYKGRSNNFLVKLDKRGKLDIFPLKLAFEIKIIRHVKIDCKANPFDTDWRDYFEERETYKMKLSLKGRSSLLYMWKKQNKECTGTKY